MIKNLTNDDIHKNVEIIINLIENNIEEPNKTILLNVLNDDLGAIFFSAPASSNTNYHLAVPGGLAAHCINVINSLFKLNDAFDCGFSKNDIILCSLLHDFGKVSTPDLKSPHYKTQEEKWKAEKRGEVYERDYSKGYLTNRDRTTFILQSLGLKLNFEQYQAILVSDGFFSEQNKSYQSTKESRCSKLSLYLHFADFISSIEEQVS
jgi:hypothetical protein